LLSSRRFIKGARRSWGSGSVLEHMLKEGQHFLGALLNGGSLRTLKASHLLAGMRVINAR